MVRLQYQIIERQLADALPELQAAVNVYAKVEGPPGADPGAYIFFEDMFACYIEVLLAMRESSGRNRLLARAFGFVEDMLQSDDYDVRNLAAIGLFEGRQLWWCGRAVPFLGPATQVELNRLEPRWLDAASLSCGPDPEREIIDIYGARDAISRELQDEGYGMIDIPGITAPRSRERFPDLEYARSEDDAVVFVSCFGTSHPYVVSPVRDVRCDEPALRQLARDLADIDQRELNQKEKAQAAFFRISLQERVWNMKVGATQHARFDGTMWIAERFVQRGLAPDILAVLSGTRRHLVAAFRRAP